MLFFTQVLDREKSDKFSFHILATDNGSPKLFAFTKMKIKVNDINDRMPEFTKQIYRVNLYSPVFNNTEVATVHATDGDTNVFGSVQYSLQSHTELFKISPKSGQIWTKNAAKIKDRSYSLQVAASDGIFTSTCRVLIDMLPIKKNTFKFSKDVFETSVPENNGFSRLVSILSTVGYDIGECIHFSIANPMKEFLIDANTGEIKTRYGSEFDREKQPFYLLIVQARLKRDPSQVAQSIVNVSVSDLNDNEPVFIGKPYYQSVNIETPAGSPLITVQARDADEGSNSEVRYELLPRVCCFPYY